MIEVQTGDGFLLGLQRIISTAADGREMKDKDKDAESLGAPVLLLHGILLVRSSLSLHSIVKQKKEEVKESERGMAALPLFSYPIITTSGLSIFFFILRYEP